MSATVVVLLGAIVAAAFTIWGLRRFNEITFVDVPGVEPPADGGAVNWLLIGTDGREGIDPNDPNAGAFLGEQVVGKRTDTMMLVRVDPGANSVDLLSVPRDLWVPIAGSGESGRINGAYNGDDGRQRLVATISDVLQVDVHHYAEVNFVGFSEIVDSLDGVPLWFEHPARDIGSGLNIVESGCHILDGTQALAFVRARTFEERIDGEWRLEPSADLGRTTRQRDFLARVIDAATDKIGVTQLGTVNEMLSVGGKNLLIEDGATVSDMVSLARIFTSLEADRIFDHSLPVEDFRTGGGAQVLRLKEAEAREVLELFRDGRPPAAPVLDGLEADGGGGPVVALTESTFAGSATGASNDPVPGYGTFGFTPSSSAVGTPCE